MTRQFSKSIVSTEEEGNLLFSPLHDLVHINRFMNGGQLKELIFLGLQEVKT
jgi:hypothetical protein